MTKLEKFIEKANQVHNNQYDYSLVEYINAHTKIAIICPVHGQFQQTPADHTHKKAGCKECAKHKRKQTCLRIYGTEHPRQNKQILEKQKQTNLKRYGVDNPSKTTLVRDKIKQTNLERYGHVCSVQNTEIQARIKQHNIDMYGVDYCAQRPDKIKKTIDTWIKNYGVDNPNKTTLVRDKIKQTNLERYGCHPRQTPEVKEKQKQTCLDRYGITNPNYISNPDMLIFLNDYDWLFDQYVTQNKTAIQIAKELNVGSDTTIGRYLRKHEIEIKQYCQHSYKAIQWLESIMEQEGIFIQHALNDGEYQIPDTRYKADGYCKETNTIYEFYGDYWHGNPDVYDSELLNETTNCTMGELYQRTIKREQRLRDLGYNIVVVWERELFTIPPPITNY